MNNLFRRSAVLIATAAAPMAAVTLAAPAVSATECDGGRTWDPVAKLCDPPPPVPAWYQAAPSYAQPWAPPWAPPPPPPPSWAVQWDLKPVWDPRLNAWTWIYVR
jgi:hypothetical protein